jgi:hypothetical protein
LAIPKNLAPPAPLTIKRYLLALPFSVGMLVIPLLPTAALAYLLRGGRAPLVGALLALLTFGFPVLRAKRPRAAWWVGTVVAVGSVVGLVLVNAAMATFFRYFAVLTWGLAIGFVVLNRKELRPWTFVAFALLVLYHMVPLGVAQTLLFLVGMGLMALYFMLPDRDNFALAPIVVSLVMAAQLAHGGSFYLDVGGEAEITGHPAATEVFRYTGQRRGWARRLGSNPRFLSPTCREDYYLVGTKFSWKSSLMVLQPSAPKRRQVTMQVQMPGGTTDNVAIDCRARALFIGATGPGEIYTLDSRNPEAVLAREKLDGVKPTLLRLDRSANRLYVGSQNKPYLHVMRANNLAEIDRVEFTDPVSDMVLDDGNGTAMVVVTQDGMLTRVVPKRPGPPEKSVEISLGLGKLYYNLAIDEPRRRVFVGSMFDRELRILNADTLETVATLPVPMGGRFMQFDSKRGLLYLSNFYHGTIAAYAFDEAGQGSEVWKVGVGRRVRYLTHDGRRDQLCFTSQVGGYCLNLEVLSPAPPEPEPEPTPTPVPEPVEPDPATAGDEQ